MGSRRRPRGFLLPMAVMLCFLVMVLGYSLSELARRQLRLATKRIVNERAQAAADGGLALALATLASNQAYSGTASAVTLAEGPETYSISVLKAGSLTPEKQVVPASCVYVVSKGTMKGAGAKYACALVKLSAGSSGFSKLRAVITNTLNMNNGTTMDSYSSKLGVYNKGKNSGSNANVATNLAKAGSIQIYGGSSIAGTISVPPGGVVEKPVLTTPVSGSNTVWHDWGAPYASGSLMTSVIDLPPVTLPTAVGKNDFSFDSKSASTALGPGSYRSVTVSNGANLVLKPGVYVFSKLTLNGGAKLSLSDPSQPVQIYIADTFDINNGVNFNGNGTGTTGLQMYLAEGSKYIQSGGTNVTGILYGPKAEFQLSNGINIYGAVVANTLTMNGSATIHYDEALASYNLPVSGGSSTPATATVLFRQRN